MATIKHYNSIINNPVYSDTKLSIGFRRTHLLPKRMYLNLVTKWIIENPEKDTKFFNRENTPIFEKMTESEYKDFILRN